MIDQKLLKILVCPKCKKPVEPDEAHERLICRECGLAYPIEKEIPVMLIEEAEEIDTDGAE